MERGEHRMAGSRARARVAILFAALLILGASGAYAESNRPGGRLQVTEDNGAVHLSWEGLVQQDSDGFPSIQGWPPVEIQGGSVPARLIALRTEEQGAIEPRVEVIEEAAWRGRTPSPSLPTMRALDGKAYSPREESRETGLPDSPVTVLREGRIRGSRVIVVAVSPLFEQAGRVKVASHVRATIPNASVLTGTVSLFSTSSGAFLRESGPPPSAAAARPAWKVIVAAAGMQRVTGAALIDAGFDPESGDPARLHLRRRGEEVALELRGTTDGRLDPNDELRFYAPAPGDRWNSTDTYWLTIEATPGARMASRNVQPGGALLRRSAVESGRWHSNTLYDSTLPGADGDHWFAAELLTGPGQAPAAITVPLTWTLPSAAGTTVVTITGSAYTAGRHQLQVGTDGDSHLLIWEGLGDWTKVVTTTGEVQALSLTLVPGFLPDGIQVDGIAWERPARLEGGRDGAVFRGVAGNWRYEVSSVTQGQTLYDVTAPLAPVLLGTSTGSTLPFEDGQQAREYLLDGPRTLRTPRVNAHIPVDLAVPLNADVVYVAPAIFHDDLEPLLAHRRAQGYSVRGVDVQVIYDAWSDGQVSPIAIRDFLRYAASTWSRPPIAAVLVGDGSSDPHNYTGRNNTNFVPPYLEMVDPWLGETACETCFGQLDGPDPLDDPLPDVAIGRLPIKSSEELAGVVAKILAYETGDVRAPSRNVYLADNYRNADGSVDGAGDFAAFAEASIALQPGNIEIRRMYYDPSSTRTDAPWVEPDAVAAHERTIELLDAGAGIVNYIGHAYYWQWASTDPSGPAPYLLELYDVDELKNGRALPVLLEMTCLTSAFQEPSYSGTTIDERFLRSPGGGAIAVWGPSGFGVAHGHDTLQSGFYRALWESSPGEATLGALTTAGYLELFTRGACCQDALRTFLLLGDPMTAPRVVPGSTLFLPLIRR